MSSFDTNDLKTEINTIFNATTNGPMRTLNASPEVGLSVDTLDVQKEGGSAVQDEAPNDEAKSNLIKRPHNVRIPFTLPSLGRHCAGTPWLLMTFHDFSYKNEELWVMDIPITVRSFSFLY
jgi:hypothetical protein